MLVRKWMSKNVVTVDETDAMDTAIRTMKEKNIRMLPVTRKGKLVGVVTDRDLKRASASDATTLDVHELLYLISTIPVKRLMSRHPVTVPPDFTVEETAEILLEKKISGVPVVEKSGRLVGVITQSDIDRVLIALTGVGKRGIQFAVQAPDRPGSIKEIADVLREYGARIVSILTSYEKVPGGRRNVYIRVFDLDRSRLEEAVDRLHRLGDLLYLVDHREDRRQIWEA